MAKKVSVGVEIKGDPKNYKAAAKDAANATKELRRKANANSREMERKFKAVTMSIAKVAGAFVVAKKALQAYTKVMSSTNIGADKIAITQNKIKFALNQVSRSIAQADFKDFGKDIKEAAKQGEALALQLDLIGDLQLRLMLITSDANLAIVQQELIFRNTALSATKRKAAAEEYLRLVKELETEQLKFAQQQVKGALAASSIAASGMDEARLNYYVRNMDLLAENEAAVLSYLQAIKDLDEQKARPAETVMLEGYFQAGQEPAEMERLAGAIAGASDIVKDFASDYMQWMSIIEPERLGLTEAWAQLGEIQAKAAREMLKPLRSVSSLLKEGTGDIERYKESWEGIKPIKSKPDKIDTTTLHGEVDPLRPLETAMTDGLSWVGDLESAFLAFFSQTEGGFEAMAASFGNALQSMAAQLAAKAAIFGILTLLTGGGSVLAAKALSNFSWFADGGIVSGPTLGMVGEYPGAATNPEVIAPLNTLKGMLGETAQGAVKVEGVISGRDLALIMRRNS